MNASIITLGQMTFLNFFNSKEIYTRKGFATERKARNYAKKFNITVFESLPESVSAYMMCD